MGIPAFARACIPTLRYWMETEVHVYAFSIAANVLLSFYPFLIVMITICRYVLHWPGAERAILFALNDAFPGDLGGFVQRNLLVTVADRGPLQVGSIFLLFFTANGVFEPLEVALNRAWGISANRSFIKNQLVSLFLILLCGALVLLSAILTGNNQELLVRAGLSNSPFAAVLGTLLFKAAAVPISILLLFLIYWVLPNRRLPARSLLPVSIVIGLALELLKTSTCSPLPG